MDVGVNVLYVTCSLRVTIFMIVVVIHINIRKGNLLSLSEENI